MGWGGGGEGCNRAREIVHSGGIDASCSPLFLMLPLKRRKLHLHLKHEQRSAAADESESLRLKQAATLKAEKGSATRGRRLHDSARQRGRTSTSVDEDADRCDIREVGGRVGAAAGGQRETHKEHQGRRRPLCVSSSASLCRP